MVALSLAPVDAAVHSARSLMIQVLPATLLLTALVTWLGVGRALAPVERMRRGVAAIGGGDLSKRVPLPAAHDEIHRLAGTMNGMLDRLEAAAGRQRRFVADASHELRSPLANMQASLEVALARQDLDLWQETGHELRGEYERMRRLVEDLLLLARLDGHIPLAHQDVDLDDVVHHEAERLRRHAEVTVHVVPLPALRVSGDGARLAQVVGNLADNAARHAAAPVSFSLRRDDDWAVVQLADDGPGVPPEDRTRIFDRFTRLDHARARDHGGSGLGLRSAERSPTPTAAHSHCFPGARSQGLSLSCGCRSCLQKSQTLPDGENVPGGQTSTSSPIWAMSSAGYPCHGER